jgi:hypothetical protein
MRAHWPCPTSPLDSAREMNAILDFSNALASTTASAGGLLEGAPNHDQHQRDKQYVHPHVLRTRRIGLKRK